jgi:hypothetical protein
MRRTHHRGTATASDKLQKCAPRKLASTPCSLSSAERRAPASLCLLSSLSSLVRLSICPHLRHLPGRRCALLPRTVAHSRAVLLAGATASRGSAIARHVAPPNAASSFFPPPLLSAASLPCPTPSLPAPMRRNFYSPVPGRSCKPTNPERKRREGEDSTGGSPARRRPVRRPAGRARADRQADLLHGVRGSLLPGRHCRICTGRAHSKRKEQMDGYTRGGMSPRVCALRPCACGPAFSAHTVLALNAQATRCANGPSDPTPISQHSNAGRERERNRCKINENRHQ